MAVKQKISLNDIEEIVKQTRLQHIAIIMDGNRRWAKNHRLPSASGHNAGVNSLKTVVNYAGKIGVKYLTVYAFSTENWGRKPDEVNFLMFLLGETIKTQINDLHKNNVKVRIIGDLTRLSGELIKILDSAMKKTENNAGLNLQIAINYGSRDEITNAVKMLSLDIKNGKILPEQVTEELISDYLYTAKIPDPELLIRTGGEQRLSNYLLWQVAYTEFYVTDTLWPDFNEKELDKSIFEFAGRSRRFGKD